MGGREIKKTWTTVMMICIGLDTCPLPIFVGSLVNVPVSSVVWRQPSLAASPPPPSLRLWGAQRASTTPVWLQQERCWCFHGALDSLLSPHPGPPSLPDPLHSTSLPAWNFCAGQDSVPGGRWAGHEPQDFCIPSSAAGRISEWPCIQLSLPTHRLCCVTLSDHRSSDWSSLCRAGMRLYLKD